MGAHSVPRGEKSTMGAANGSSGTKGYQGQHRAEDKQDENMLSKPGRVTRQNNNYDRQA